MQFAEDKLVVLLLSQLDWCGLLGCSLVCKQWARLVPQTCRCITLHLKRSSQAHGFAAFARKHGRAVEDLTLTTLLAHTVATDALREVYASLHSLTSLTSLALFCECTDTDAADFFKRLPQTLTCLDLGLCTTSLTSSSVDSISALSNLLKLDMSHSCLGNSGLQMIAGKMPQLRDLRLSYCRPAITGPGLAVVSAMTSLTCLHCCAYTAEEVAALPLPATGPEQQEEGQAPTQQGHVVGGDTCLQPAEAAVVLKLLPAGLQELNLRGHALGTPGAAALTSSPAATSLTWLNLAACKLDDQAAAMLGSPGLLPAIETMDLSRNAITMAGLHRALSPGLPLRSLDLSRNQIRDGHEGLQQLMIVDQHHSYSDSSSEPSTGLQESQSTPDLLGSSVAGTSVSASMQDVWQAVGAAAGAAAGAASAMPGAAQRPPASASSSEGRSSAFAAVADTLQDLSLASNVLKSQGIQALWPLQGLRQLNLSSCSITDAGLQGLSELQQLQLLDLSRNPDIMNAWSLLGQLSKLTALKQLQLEDVGLQDSAVAQVYVLLGNMQIADAAARNPKVAEAAVLHLPSCGVQAGTNLPESVLVLTFKVPSDVLEAAQQVLKSAAASASVGSFARAPGAVVVLDSSLPRLQAEALDLNVLLPEVLHALNASLAAAAAAAAGRWPGRHQETM